MMRKLVVGVAVRQDIRALAAELGVGRLVDAQLAAGCTGLDLSVLERRAADVAAARRARAVFEATVGARMPGLKIKWPSPRVVASSAAMPPLPLPWPSLRGQAGAAGVHAPMPPLTFAAR